MTFNPDKPHAVVNGKKVNVEKYGLDKKNLYEVPDPRPVAAPVALSKSQVLAQTVQGMVFNLLEAQREEEEDQKDEMLDFDITDDMVSEEMTKTQYEKAEDVMQAKAYFEATKRDAAREKLIADKKRALKADYDRRMAELGDNPPPRLKQTRKKPLQGEESS